MAIRIYGIGWPLPPTGPVKLPTCGHRARHTAQLRETAATTERVRAPARIREGCLPGQPEGRRATVGAQTRRDVRQDLPSLGARPHGRSTRYAVRSTVVNGEYSSLRAATERLRAAAKWAGPNAIAIESQGSDAGLRRTPRRQPGGDPAGWLGAMPISGSRRSSGLVNYASNALLNNVIADSRAAIPGAGPGVRDRNAGTP